MGFGSGGGGFSGGRGDQDGDLTVRGTTPQITIGDAGAEDTFLIFDGNAPLVLFASPLMGSEMQKGPPSPGGQAIEIVIMIIDLTDFFYSFFFIYYNNIKKTFKLIERTAKLKVIAIR